MYLKFLILDEIKLEVVYDNDNDNLTPMIFSSKDNAIEYAEKHIQAWQIIEVPFSDE